MYTSIERKTVVQPKEKCEGKEQDQPRKRLMRTAMVSGVIRSSRITTFVRVFLITMSVWLSLVAILALVCVACCGGSREERDDFANVCIRINRDAQIIMMVCDARRMAFWTRGRRAVRGRGGRAAMTSGMRARVFVRMVLRRAWSGSIREGNASARKASWAWTGCRCCGSSSRKRVWRPVSRRSPQNTGGVRVVVWFRCERRVRWIITVISLRNRIRSISIWVSWNACLLNRCRHRLRVRVIHGILRVSTRSQVRRTRHRSGIVTVHSDRQTVWWDTIRRDANRKEGWIRMSWR